MWLPSHDVVRSGKDACIELHDEHAHEHEESKKVTAGGSRHRRRVIVFPTTGDMFVIDMRLVLDERVSVLFH